MNLKQNQNQKYILLSLVLLIGLFFSGDIAEASEISSGNVIELVNLSRKYQGLDILTENSKLNAIALDKAKDMLENNYFSHNSPSGLTPWYWFEKNNYNYKYAGENLAIDFVAVEDQHEAWMESATHRKNILNEHYKEIGVAVVAGKIKEKVSLLTVQVFGTETGKIYPLSEREEVLGKADGVPSLSQKQMVLSSGSFRPESSLSNSRFNTNVGRQEMVNLGWMLLAITFLSVLAINPMILTFNAYRLIFSGLKNKRYHQNAGMGIGFQKPFHIDSAFMKFMKMKI